MTVRRTYIDAAGIGQARLLFVWDEWNVVSTYEPTRPDEVARLQTLTKRANCALTIGIAEWILARFEGMDADPDPAHFIEAAWAANIDTRYAYEIDIVDDEWRGPVRGPISMALTFVQDALFAEEAGANSSMNPAWAACFARHVLPDSTAFDAWFAACLARLEQHGRAPHEDDADWFASNADGGRLLPAQVLDPARAFDPARTDADIDAFLGGLDPRRNEFLSSPEDMVELGFEGTPYRHPPL